ncbi:MAG: hypothetical protein E7241_11220 [Lachnospiraceae bacterium]|nr:hypothetical protein [Lachnospiraceae bacterium]
MKARKVFGILLSLVLIVGLVRGLSLLALASTSGAEEGATHRITFSVSDATIIPGDADPDPTSITGFKIRKSSESPVIIDDSGSPADKTYTVDVVGTVDEVFVEITVNGEDHNTVSGTALLSTSNTSANFSCEDQGTLYSVTIYYTASIELIPVDPVVTAPTLADSRDYNNEALQLIATAANSTNTTGFIYYALGTSNSVAPGNEAWTTSITDSSLIKTDVGIYYVWYKQEASTGYNAWPATCAGSVEISRLSISPTVTIADWTYGETAKTPTVTGNTGNGAETFSYSGRNGTSYAADSTPPTDAGDYTVTATIAQTANYNGDTATADFSIAKAANPITFENQSFSKSVSAEAQSVAPVATGEGAITFTIQSQKKGDDLVTYFSVDGSNLKIAANTPSGTYTVEMQAEAAGGNNYNSGTKSATITVDIGKTAISPTVTIEGWTYGAVASTPTVTGNPGDGAVTYEYKETSADDSTYTTTVPTKVGSYTLRITIAATDEYGSGTATATFTISKKNVTVSGYSAENKVYDGTNVPLLSGTPIISGKMEGDDVTFSGATATFADAAVGTNKTITITGELIGADKDNYNLTSIDTITASITKRPITITAADQTVEIGGSITTYAAEHDMITISGSGLVTGHTLDSLTLTGSGTASATTTGTITPSASVIKSGSTPVTENYNITFEQGNLTVTKRAPIVNTTPTAGGITYGQALSASTISGSMKDPSTSAAVAGTFAWDEPTTKPSLSDSNTTEYAWTFTPASSNYEKASGTLTVTVSKAASELTLAPAAIEDLSAKAYAQNLVTAGTATGGTLMYALGSNKNTAPTSGWGASIPTATDSGTYFVWYKVVGDANHTDIDAACITVTVAEGDEETIGTYDDVLPDSGIIQDITGSEKAPKEDNPLGAGIDNAGELESLLGITASDKAQGVNVWLEVKDISSEVSSADKTLVDNALDGQTVCMYLDISLFKKVGNNDSSKVTETNGKIRLSFLVPEEYRSAEGGTYAIAVVHEGKSSLISGSYDAETHIFTFETDRFSTYALVYTPAAADTTPTEADTTPADANTTGTSATGDAAAPVAWIFLILASVSMFVSAKRCKK